MTAYNIFAKHAEKMLKKVSASRPILQGAYHQTDGSVVATDSHRLYKLYNGFDTSEAFVQNLTTGQRIDGNYPNTSKLIPDAEDAKCTIQVNVKELLDAAKGMLSAHKAINSKARHGYHLMQIMEQGNKMVLLAGTESDKFHATYDMSDLPLYGSEVNITFQPQFLIDALALFKDAGETEINIRFYGNVRPFIMESKDVTALILPVRIY